MESCPDFVFPQATPTTGISFALQMFVKVLLRGYITFVSVKMYENKLVKDPFVFTLVSLIF